MHLPRFSTAESDTACFGLSAPLAMEVAIALPVSWNPFVKSKSRAVITTMIREEQLKIHGPNSGR